MVIYTEGILWYLFLADVIIYNFLAWTQGKSHHQRTHWASVYFPLNHFLGILYAGLILWLGFALYRLQLFMWW